jgi:acetyl-CoA carboxylase alpha subunit
MALADKVLMLDHAAYEVIRPEDAARIIFQRPDRAEELAERLRLTSHDCWGVGVVDEILEEPGSGAHTDHDETARIISTRTRAALATLGSRARKKRMKARYDRYRGMGRTRARLRGTFERRMAHLTDRIAGLWNRMRRRGPLRRWADSTDEFDIPV